MNQVSNQFSQWGGELKCAYAKLNIAWRVILFALIAIGVYYIVERWNLRVARAELAQIRQKLFSLPEKSVLEQELEFARITNTTLEKKFSTLKKDVADLEEKKGRLRREDTAVTIRFLRDSMTEERLIVSSQKMISAVSGTPLRGKKMNDQLELKLPERVSCESQHFEVIGTFPEVCGFLRKIYLAPGNFFLNNLKLTSTDLPVTSEFGTVTKKVRFEFDFHVPFRKEDGK